MPLFIFQPKATPEELQTNGLGILEASDAVVSEEINGQFSISLIIPPGARNFDAVIGGAIVRADTPRGAQLFRLSKPVAALDGGVQAYGWHISYDLAQDMILDRYWVGKTGAEVLSEILQAGISERRFTGTSDIDTVNSMRIVRTSVLAALIGDEDNCFRKRWGGEIERDGFTVNMKARLGEDRGVTIRYRKNLTGLTIDENWDEIANRIIPVGLTDADAPLLLPEVYIDSGRIDDTPVPCAREAAFSDVQVGAEDEEGNVPYPDTSTAYAELRARVAQMYDQGADLPTVTAEVCFIDLAKTEEYKDFATLETARLGDTITCTYKEINLQQRVMSYEYNALTGRYISIVLGDVATTLGDTVWAQDLDLSALQDKMTSTVKQGRLYNNVYITHADGFVAEAEIGGQAVKAMFNAAGMGWYDDEENLIGGAAVVNGLLALIASVLTNDTNSNCYATIGAVELNGNVYQGIFIYRKDYSTANPVLKLVAYSNGNIALSSDGHGWLEIFSDGALAYYDQNGDNRLLLDYNGKFVIWDTADRIRLELNSSDSYIRAPGTTNHAVGADTGGPYRVKNNVKTYF